MASLSYDYGPTTTRNQPISSDLERLLIAAGQSAGVDQIVIGSGGQDAASVPNARRVGSTTNHDHGDAADLRLVVGGRTLDFTNPTDLAVFQTFVTAARQNGAAGIGAGIDYMGPQTIHVGVTGNAVPWGADGRAANAPDWLVSAYNATGSAPVQPVEVAALGAPEPTTPAVAPPPVTTNPTPAGTTQGFFGGPVQMQDMFGAVTNPSPATLYQAQQEATGGRPSQTGGFWNAVGAATDQQWLTNWLFNGDSRFEEDPNFQLTRDSLEQFTEGLPENYWAMFSDARSQGHAEFLRNYALEDMQKTQLLGEMGVGGLALSFAAAILDPAAIAVGVGTGFIGSAILKGQQIGRIGTRLIGALLGGGSEAAYAATGVLTNNPNSSAADILFGAALGASVGFAMGPRMMNPATRAETTRLGEIATEVLNENVGGGLGPNRSVGAASTMPETEFLTDPSLAALSATEAAETALSSVRFDLFASLASSSSSLVRHAAGLVHDAVGKVGGKVNSMSASEERSLFFDRWMGDWARTVNPAFNDWAERNNISKIRRTEAVRQRFYNEAASYVRNRDPAVQFDPAVAQAGDKFRGLMDQIRQDLANPMGRDGLTGRAVPGFGELAANKHYMPRQADVSSINNAVEVFGEGNVIRLLNGAITKANPDWSPEIIEKIARGWVTNHRKRFYSINDDVVRAYSAGDKEALRRILSEDTELSNDEIDAIMDSMTRPYGADGGADTRGKQRILMDESFFIDAPLHSKTGVGTPGKLDLTDFFVNDLNHVAVNYLRWAAGRVALSRFKVRNPDTGELVVNGFTSDAEFAKYVEAIKRESADERLNASQKKKIAKDIERLQFAYDHIMGRPPPASMEKYAEWLGLAKNFNLLRVGGQFGFAQANEFANIVGQIGIKAALTQMPAFKRIRSMNGESVLKDGLGRELEAIFGPGTDRMTGVLSGKWVDHNGGTVLRGDSPTMVKANDALQKGGRAIMDMSMMRPITMLQQRWAAKAIAQKFANMALGKSPSVKQKARMRELGLDDQMLDRVIDQIKGKFTTTDGVIFKHKVQLMNLDNWTDLEARSAFENALFRYTRRVIQENDIGNLAKWMSHPIGQMIVQFRTFMLASWAKNLLHNIHMRDFETFVYFSASTIWSAATFAAWTNVKAIGREDREEYLAKNLSVDRLIAGGLGRSGWSSLLPMGVDSAAAATGFDPFFDVRSSGQSQDPIFGNPTMGLIPDVKGALSGILEPLIDGRERTQAEYRAMIRVLPFQNSMPFVQAYNALIGGAPQ